MTERNTSSERLSERDVDRLLQRFFVREVPAEFRQEEAPVAIANPQLEPLVRSATPTPSRNLAGLLGILVSATCCLIVTLFIPGESTEKVSTNPFPVVGGNTRPQPDADRSVPFEERNHLPFTSLGNPDDATGSETEATDPLGPELEIEIFPLRPDKPRE